MRCDNSGFFDQNSTKIWGKFNNKVFNVLEKFEGHLTNERAKTQGYIFKIILTDNGALSQKMTYEISLNFVNHFLMVF